MYINNSTGTTHSPAAATPKQVTQTTSVQAVKPVAEVGSDQWVRSSFNRDQYLDWLRGAKNYAAAAQGAATEAAEETKEPAKSESTAEAKPVVTVGSDAWVRSSWDRGAYLSWLLNSSASSSKPPGDATPATAESAAPANPQPADPDPVVPPIEDPAITELLDPPAAPIPPAPEPEPEPVAAAPAPEPAHAPQPEPEPAQQPGRGVLLGFLFGR